MDRLNDHVEEARQPDVETILENVVKLEEMLDEGSKRELDALPYLELSKHLRINRS